MELKFLHFIFSLGLQYVSQFFHTFLHEIKS